MTGGQVSILERNKRLRDQKAADARRLYADPEKRARMLDQNNKRYHEVAERARKVRDWLEQGRECSLYDILFGASP